MKTYTYYPELNDNEELIWFVYEHVSGQIVAEFFFEEDAHDLCEFLSKGGGFAGFTPSFILRKVFLKNINDAFAVEFS